MTDQTPSGFRAGYLAIVGRPNVGKSSLLNRIVGEKLAITSHKPQTTRHSILGIKSTDTYQIVCVDTPGIHSRGDQPMNRYLNRTARSVLGDVDLLLFVVEAGRWTQEDQMVLEAIATADLPVVLAVNKVDLHKDKEELLPFLGEMGGRHPFAEILPVSARKGSNLESLERCLVARLPEGEAIFPVDQLSDRSERFFAAELIREQLTRRFDKELPYALTVEIERFEEEGELYRIHGLVWVEKPGQKAILIGKNGEAMRDASTNARKAMERFFGCKVYLRVWVKVKKSWSSDEQALASLGYKE
jgi:GTP-binding protein Era